MTFRTIFFALMAGASLQLAGLIASAQQMLPGHVPAVIAQMQLPPLGRLARTNRLHLALGLPLRNREILTNLLEQIYDPQSPNFHKYLTPDQFTERFGPTTNDYQTVINFARSHGLEISGTHRSRHLLDVRGSVAAIEAAFHVTLQTYQHPTESRIFYAPDVAPSVDDGVPIQEITGINDYAKLHPAAHAAKAGNATGSGLDGLYRGKDFRNAYVPGSSLAGSGQYVGLFEADGYYASDIELYEKFAGYTNVPLQNVLIDGFSGTPASGELEVPLDIEVAIAMAPALAGVVVFESPNNVADWIDMLDTMADDTKISQFSSSWGYTGGSNPNAAYDDVFIEMAAQGQSFFQCAGDGDAWTNPIWVPAASPYLTVVGGTFLTMSNNGTGYISEKVWNSGNYTTNGLGQSGGWAKNGNGYWGSGGGITPYYSIPSWQAGINMTTNLGSTTQRNIPDVAMVGFDIYLVYNNGTTNSYSFGTSGPTPMWASLTALVNQQAAASHKLPIGFLNPTLYALAQQTTYTNIFHDITSGNNFSAVSPANYPAAPGYDLCTGLGTPRGTNFITAVVATLPGEAVPVITDEPTNEVVAVGGTASFSLTATGMTPLAYFWRLNGAFMAGQTNASFTTNNVQLVNSGQQFTCVVSNSLESITSSIATLTVLLPPGIVASSPTNQTVAAGGSASFTVSVSGGSPLGYFWLCNGSFMPGATSATYTTNNVQPADSGAQFSCLVSNPVGTTTSQAAVLTVDLPPGITTPPASQTVAAGANASFTVTATGTTPLHYFWRLNGAFMPGQTNASFTTNNVQLVNSGQQFSCLVSNLVGSVTSIVATLTVDLPPTITAQPTNQTVPLGGTALFALTATGTSLQEFWLRNGIFMSGQTNAAFTTNHVQLTNSGTQFSCLVSNTVGSVTSSVVTLTVSIGAAQTPGFNISLAGTNLIITGTNGIAGGTYTLLMSTNLARLPGSWTSVATNVLGVSGHFSITATNAVSPRSPEQFYRLQLQ